jgi:hypothetical protein
VLEHPKKISQERLTTKELNRAPLNLTGVSTGAVRILCVSVLDSNVAILSWISVDDAGDHALILGVLDFEPTEDASV